MIKFNAPRRRTLFTSAARYNVRIFLALCGTVGIAWALQQIPWTIPLTLGVVAAALADLDDRLTGRLRNLIITLVCFCIASVSVELLFPYPWFSLQVLRCRVGDLFCSAHWDNATPPLPLAHC